MHSSFVFSKIQAESGEDIQRIIERKNYERQLNDGQFLWGIGNSIRPGVLQLLRESAHPRVQFALMKSPPKPQDVRPDQICVWFEGLTLDNRLFRLPTHSLVSSRVQPNKRLIHYALVCEKQLDISLEKGMNLNIGEYRNFKKGGKAVGSSQVTSVVTRDPTSTRSGPIYDVGFGAHLVPPYFVKLVNGRRIGKENSRNFLEALCRVDSISEYRRFLHTTGVINE